MVALVANVAAGPFVGPVTILELAAGLLSLLSPPLAAVVGWAAGWCVQPIVIIVARIVRPGSHETTGHPGDPDAARRDLHGHGAVRAASRRASSVAGRGTGRRVAGRGVPGAGSGRLAGDWAVVACDVGQAVPW